MIKDLDEYKITLKYYQGGVLSSTLETDWMIANEKDLSLKLGRNQQFEGVYQEFSGLIIFVLTDRDWILDKRADYLSRLDADTKIIIDFYMLNAKTLAYDLDYTGRLDWTSITSDKYYAECQFYQDDVINRLNRIQDIPITVESDGSSFVYKIPLSAKLDSTSIVYYGNNSDTYAFVGDSTNTINSGERMNDPSDTFRDLYNETFMQLYLYPLTKNVVVTKNYNARLIVNYDGTGPDIGSEVTLSIKAIINYDDGGSLVPVTIKTETKPLLGLQQVFDITLDEYKIPIDDSRIQYDELNPNDGSYITVFAEYDLTDATGNDIDVVFLVFGEDGDRLGMYCTFDGETVDSVIYGQDYRTLLDSYEDLLGIDINTDYLNDTVYADMLLTTSRGVKGIRPLNYNIQFNELFNSLKSFIALSLSQSGNTVYLNPITDAYDDSEIIDIGELLYLEILPSEKIYNSLTIGNSGGGSSNFDYGDLDPLAPATYELGLDDETEKDFTNRIRVDASTINKAAIDFEKVATSIADRDEDKDLYLIAYNPSETYIQSNFTLVDGIDVDKFGQMINTEFSKSRQLYNWRNYLGHLFTGFSEYTLKSWDKNKDLVYTDTGREIEIIDTPSTIIDCKSFNSKYAQFNGTNNDITYITSMTQDIYIEMELIIPHVDGKDSGIFRKGTTGFSGFDIAIWVQSNKQLRCMFRDESNGLHTPFTIDITQYIDDEYHLLKIISISGTYEVFIDNILIKTGTDTTPLRETSTIAYFLKQYNNTDYVQTKLRSAIFADANFDFEYTNGTTLYDSSGNNNHATINGTLAGFINDDTEQSSRDRDGYGKDGDIYIPRLNDGVNELLPLSLQKDILGNYLIRGCQPLFGTSTYNAKLALTSEKKQLIYNNRNKIFKFSFDNIVYYGYLEDIEYNPLYPEEGEIRFTQAAI